MTPDKITCTILIAAMIAMFIVTVWPMFSRLNLRRHKLIAVNENAFNSVFATFSKCIERTGEEIVAAKFYMNSISHDFIAVIWTRKIEVLQVEDTAEKK